MTRSEAEAFLALQDRSRIVVLMGLTPTERAQALVAIALALGIPAEREQRMLA